jgi:hypothetical protein
MELLAPNGKPSNLTPEQYKLVRTPAFKKWFGDWESKQFKNNHKPHSEIYPYDTIAVDENGEPRIWHRATHYDYTEFDNEYIYLGSKKSYVKQYGKPKEFFIKPKKTIFIDNEDIERQKLGIKFDYLAEYISDENGIPRKGNNYDKLKKAFENQKEILAVWEYFTLVGNQEILNLFKNWFNEYGFDSAMYWETGLKNNFGKYPVGLICVYFDNQIKLADGTNTTFDGNNPDIRFELGGELLSDNMKKHISYLNKLLKNNDAGSLKFAIKSIDDIISTETSSIDLQEYKTLQKEIKKNGVVPILIDESNSTIIDGNHRWKLLNKMGIKNIPVFILKANDNLWENDDLYMEFDYQYKNETPLISINEFYADGGSVLLAPNGKPSNLSPEQYKLVRTPEFKAWYGDWEKAYETGNYDNVSKVIDEQTKEPLVVYHGSKKKFNVFKFTQKRDKGFLGAGFYFTNSKKMAQMYAQYRFVYEVFLNIKNPLIVKELKSDIIKKNNSDGVIYCSEELLKLDKE